MGVKPLYVVRLNADSRPEIEEYYSRSVSWSGVSRDKATKLTHKEARGVRDWLHGIRQGYRSIVEPA